MNKEQMSPERIVAGQRLSEANLAIHAGRIGLAEARSAMPADEYGIAWHEGHVENAKRDRNEVLAELKTMAPSPSLPPAISWPH